MSDTDHESATPRFQVGGKVRARRGVTAPDFEDIPLGGWAGTVTGIEQVEGQIDYEVEWDRRTLDAMHSIYRKRCERDDLDPKAMWLREDDLEPDEGSPVPIEQPTEIVTPPLSEKDQDDRVRTALGLTHDDPLPEISHEALLAYHRYLAANLKLPFSAIYGEEVVGPYARRRLSMIVTGLLTPEGSDLFEEDGLICTGEDRGKAIEFPLGEIEVKKKDPNFRPISDYAYWLHNWPCRDEGDIIAEVDSLPGVTSWIESAYRDVNVFDREASDRAIVSEVTPPGLRLWAMATLVCGVGGLLLGAAIGAALRTINGAGLAAMTGGIPLGIIGAFVLGRYGLIFGAVNRVRYGAILGAILGSLGGGLVGVIAGLTVVAMPWSLLGLIVGMFLGPYVIPQKERRLVSFRVAFLGACGGILVSAFRHDQARAVSGAVPGLIAGMIAGAGLFLALIGSLFLFPAWPMESGWTDGKPCESDGDDEDGILPMKPTSGRRR